MTLPVRLPQNREDVVIGSNDDLGIPDPTARRQSRRAQILPIRGALEDVARSRAETPKVRGRGLRLRDLPADARPSASLRVGALIQTTGEQNEIADGHALAVRELPALANRAVDRDVPRRTKFRRRENSDLVVFLERKVVDDRAGRVAEGGAKLKARRVGSVRVVRTWPSSTSGLDATGEGAARRTRIPGARPSLPGDQTSPRT